MTSINTAAINALALLKSFTSSQGADDLLHFDREGFLKEMEARAAAAGRKLSRSEYKTLHTMIETYCEREGVVL